MERLGEEGFGQKSEEFKIPSLLREKILAAWGSARDQLGAPNLHRLAELLYKALYHPETISDAEVKNSAAFANREEVLKKVFAETQIPQDKIPSEEEFISELRRALTRDADFSEAVFPGAKETIVELADKGPVTIWTQGDVKGPVDETYKGSQEQYVRLINAGFGDLRRQIAQEKNVAPQEALAFLANEDKLSLLPDLLKKYSAQGVELVVVIDDRLQNLETAGKTAQEFPDLKMVLVLVKAKGADKNETAQIKTVASINEVPELLKAEDLQDGKLGFIVDYDDVLSDDRKRQEIQIESVTRALRAKDWML